MLSGDEAVYSWCGFLSDNKNVPTFSFEVKFKQNKPMICSFTYTISSYIVLPYCICFALE